MDELDALQRYIADHPTRAFFQPPAAPAEIDSLEVHLGRTLPTSFRAFLLRHDGGFIAANSSSDDPAWDPRAEAWNSIRIMSVTEIREESDRIQRPQLAFAPRSPVRYIPCIYGFNQELLVFDAAADPQTDPPILDAFHEIPPTGWESLFESFAAFLERYIEGEGDLDTVTTG